MRKLYIFDLDGTISLSGHRTHFLENKDDPHRWRNFYAAAKDDLPNPSIIRLLVNLLEAGCHIMIVTGRSDEVREETVAWLRRHIPVYQNYETILYMRKEGDHQPDTTLKQSWYNALPPSYKDDIVAVFEDRGRVVTMWRGLGVACFQVAPGEF